MLVGDEVIEVDLVWFSGFKIHSFVGRIQVAWCRVQGFGFESRVEGVGCGVQGAGSTVEGLEFRKLTRNHPGLNEAPPEVSTALLVALILIWGMGFWVGDGRFGILA